MKPLTLEETRLKEEMKHECFWDNIHYKNPEAKKTFNLICHLEDFEVQYWKLQQENKQLKEVIDKAKSLNYEISHIIYEDFLEENIIGSKFLYERIKKQLSILEDKEVSE